MKLLLKLWKHYTPGIHAGWHVRWRGCRQRRGCWVRGCTFHSSDPEWQVLTCPAKRRLCGNAIDYRRSNKGPGSLWECHDTPLPTGPRPNTKPQTLSLRRILTYGPSFSLWAGWGKDEREAEGVEGACCELCGPPLTDPPLRLKGSDHPNFKSGFQPCKNLLDVCFLTLLLRYNGGGRSFTGGALSWIDLISSVSKQNHCRAHCRQFS